MHKKDENLTNIEIIDESMKTSTGIEVKVKPFAFMKQAFDEVIAFSKERNVPVRFEFNDVHLTAFPDSGARDLATIYECKQRIRSMGNTISEIESKIAAMNGELARLRRQEVARDESFVRVRFVDGH